MNLKKLYTNIHISLIILLCILSMLVFLIFQNKANLKSTLAIQKRAYSIANTLRKSSNDLTRYCRTYISTGNSIWEYKYQEILDIRNGKKPWPNGRVISFQDSIKLVGFTAVEFQKLKLAEQNSNNLAYFEMVAMNAVKGLFDDGTGNFTMKGEPNTVLASSMLFNKEYHENKVGIMEPIEDFFVMFNERTQKKIDEYDTRSYWILGIFISLILFIIAISTVSFFMIKNKIIIQFEELKSEKEKSKEKDIENKKLLVAIEQSANSIVITNVAGDIEFVNPKFTEVSGYSLTEVLGKSLRILDSGIETEEFHTKIWETIKLGNTWKGEIQNKAKNGNLYWEQTSITPIRNNEGVIIYFLIIKEDITALKKSEQDLLNAQKIAKIGSFNLDLKTQIAKSSNTFDKIVGITSKFSKTFTLWRTITHPEDTPNNQKMLEHCIKTGEKFDAEYRIITITKQELKWIHALGEVIYKNGKPTNFVGTIQDITERKIAEQELLKAKEEAEESNHLKTEFLNNMSHEIRTPMNGILGFSHMLANPELSDEKREIFVSIIQNSGNQLLQIIDDILEISRLGTKQVKVLNEEVCLNDVLFELFSVFDIKAKENKTPLYLKKGLSNKQSIIVTDKTKLNKIVSNLLENALKFTNEGFIEMGYQLLNNKLKIYVKDTGIGIDKSKQQLIFERFSQAEKELSKKVGGLGLGLSIAKENAELLGGEITVESIKGKGTTFYIMIPYNPVYNNLETIDEITKHKYTILIAEDEEVNYLYLDTLLVDILKLDCLILHAKNGKEAIEICKNNTTIDMILMDLKMPVMNGYIATKKIRKFLPNIPIIAQTAYSTKEEEKTALEAGCTYFISKPIDKESLMNIINSYLKEIK